MADETSYQRMKKFLDECEAGHDMVKPLKKDCVVYTDFYGDSREYELVRIGNRCVLRPRQSKKAELYFGFSQGSVDYILEPYPKTVHELMNRFFDCLLEKDAGKKAVLKIRVSLIEAVGKGYLKMLSLGGARGLTVLTRIGEI